MTVKSDNLSNRVSKLEYEVKEIKEDLKSLEHLKEASIKSEVQYENIIASLKEIRKDIQTIKDKPNKYWDTVITVVLTAVITGCFTHFILH